MTACEEIMTACEESVSKNISNVIHHYIQIQFELKLLLTCFIV
jgi:hypothetical protein